MRRALLTATLVLSLTAQVVGPVSASAANSAQPPRAIDVIELEYYPLTADKQNIDQTVTVETGEPYGEIKQRVRDLSAGLETALEDGSKYRGYADKTAVPYLDFVRHGSTVYETSVPVKPHTGGCGTPERPGQCDWTADYASMMRNIDICKLVDENGIDEVWLWSYHYFFSLGAESVMSGPHGDISNSWRDSNLPVCKHTYLLYDYNYTRGVAEAMENHGHQIEAEIDHLSIKELGSTDLFRQKFQGVPYGGPYPADTGASQGCGSVHNPPNARWEYDRVNDGSVMSNCEEWWKEADGKTAAISCAAWWNLSPCNSINWSRVSTADSGWIKRWMQSLPGYGNNIIWRGTHISNWWDIYANWDVAYESGRAILTGTPASAEELALASLRIDGRTVDVAANPLIVVPYEKTKVKVEVTFMHPETVILRGIAGANRLRVGRNVIIITLVSSDGSQQQSYRLTKIYRAKPKVIRCAKGSLVKVVKGTRPKCPTGYRKLTSN